MKYRGWHIYYYPVGNCHWRAEQWGVSMCGQTPEQLQRMIDFKIAEKGKIHYV